jgi:hypothetical protein
MELRTLATRQGGNWVDHLSAEGLCRSIHVLDGAGYVTDL